MSLLIFLQPESLVSIVLRSLYFSTKFGICQQIHEDW